MVFRGDGLWTDERVERLKKLWAEGAQPRDMVTDLQVFSRSAIMGKVHRLGLAPRRVPGSATWKRKSATPGGVNTRTGEVRTPRRRSAFYEMLKAMDDMPVDPVVEVEPIVNVEKRVAFADLEDKHCRWPIGDPQDESFHFCGRNKGNGISYCDHHAQVAFQPASRRRR